MSTVHAPVRVVERPRRRWRRRPRPAFGTLRWDGTTWRRWNGRYWARPAYSLQMDLLGRRPGPETWPQPTDERLDRALELAIEEEISENAALVDHRGPRGAVVAYQRHVSHGLHALLTLLSGGVWALVWIIAATARRYDRVRLEVDRWGHVWTVPLPSRG